MWNAQLQLSIIYRSSTPSSKKQKAASHIGSMDPEIVRMCCVHVPAFLPSTFCDMQVAPVVQSAAVCALGLVFAKSCHRMLVEMLMA